MLHGKTLRTLYQDDNRDMVAQRHNGCISSTPSLASTTYTGGYHISYEGGRVPRVLFSLVHCSYVRAPAPVSMKAEGFMGRR